MLTLEELEQLGIALRAVDIQRLLKQRYSRARGRRRKAAKR
jgi:hypothetical protein